MGTLVILSWAAMLALVYFSPPFCLLVYGVLGADRDGYAIAQVMSLLVADHKLITRGLFIGLFFLSIVKFANNANVYGVKIRRLLYFVLGLSIYIICGSYVKNGDFVKSLSVLVSTGLPVCFIWNIYSQTRYSQRLFFLFIFFQVSLAVCVLVLPSFDFLNGAVFKSLEGVSVVDDFGLNNSLPDASFEKGVVGKYAIFHNPNALGFYSCAAIAVGIGVLRFKLLPTGEKIAAIMLCVFGAFGWLNSLTRGPMVMLVFGLIVVALFLKNEERGNKSTKQMFVLFGCSICFSLVAMFSDVLLYLFPESSNISVTTRFDGYFAGFDAISQYPLFGVEDKWNWPDYGYPHMLPLAFAAEHGILAGILILVIVFFGGAAVVRRALTNAARTPEKCFDHGLAILLVMVVWGAALSNNLIAPVLFWLCFSEAVIIVFGNRSLNVHRFLNKKQRR